MSSRVRNTNAQAPIVQAFRPTGMRAAPRSNNHVESIKSHCVPQFESELEPIGGFLWASNSEVRNLEKRVEALEAQKLVRIGPWTILAEDAQKLRFRAQWKSMHHLTLVNLKNDSVPPVKIDLKELRKNKLHLVVFGDTIKQVEPGDAPKLLKTWMEHEKNKAMQEKLPMDVCITVFLAVETDQEDCPWYQIMRAAPNTWISYTNVGGYVVETTLRGGRKGSFPDLIASKPGIKFPEWVFNSNGETIERPKTRSRPMRNVRYVHAFVLDPSLFGETPSM